MEKTNLTATTKAIENYCEGSTPPKVKEFYLATECDECNGKGEHLDYEWGGCYCMSSIEGQYCQCSPPDIECAKCKGTGFLEIVRIEPT